jgi:uncharacterized protein (TIGR00369 family)
MEFFIKHNQFDRENGMTFEIDRSGRVTYQFTSDKKHESSPSHTHGAAIAGYMDAVLGVCALSYAFSKQMLTSTIEFKLNFIAPVQTGTQLTGESQIISYGKRLIVCEGKIYNHKKDLVASGQGTFNLYPFEKKDFGVEPNL